MKICKMPYSLIFTLGKILIDVPHTPDPSKVNLVASASHIEWLLYLPNVRAIQYKQGPERLPRQGNSNVLRLPVVPVLES